MQFPDPAVLTLENRANGTVVQHTTTVEVEISGNGVLRNPVHAET